jgi:hypothetical protein
MVELSNCVRGSGVVLDPRYHIWVDLTEKTENHAFSPFRSAGFAQVFSEDGDLMLTGVG